MNQKDAFDKRSGVALEDAARIHGILVTLQYFSEKVSGLHEGPLKKAFSKLILLFSTDQLMVMSSHAFEVQAVDAEFLEHAKQLFEDLLDEIHDDALVLAEGFRWPESYIDNNAILAKSDGKIYENLMNYAKKFGMLNKFDVHPTMLEYIRNQQKIQREREQTQTPKL